MVLNLGGGVESCDAVVVTRALVNPARMVNPVPARLGVMLLVRLAGGGGSRRGPQGICIYYCVNDVFST